MRVLGRRHPLLEARGGLLDPVAQLHERLLDLRGVGDEVGLALAQHGALGGAQPAQLHRQHDRPQQRDGADAGGRERDDALGGGQVVHAARLLSGPADPHGLISG